MERSLATFDSYAGLEIELPAGSGRILTLPPLRFADAIRFCRVAERASAGDAGAARALLLDFPRAVGLEPGQVPEEEVSRIFDAFFDPQRYAPAAPAWLEEDAEISEGSAKGLTWDDLVADYAAVYGRAPSPDMPWPLFVALAQRAPRYEARERLRLVESLTMAIGAAFGGGHELQHEWERLICLAYPVKSLPSGGQRWIKNAAAPENQEPES